MIIYKLLFFSLSLYFFLSSYISILSISNTFFFSLELKEKSLSLTVSPQFGFYTKIVPRSSITKSGYILTNSVGIIDGTYRDTLKICLTKINNDMPDLILPFKCCQLIIEPHIHYLIKEVKSLSETDRSTGGFGSTDNKK